MFLEGLLYLLSLTSARGATPVEPRGDVVVVVDEGGRHYAGTDGSERRGFVSLRDPLVLGEGLDRRVRLWPMSWADWVDVMRVRAARTWPAGPTLERAYREHLDRFKREYERDKKG